MIPSLPVGYFTEDDITVQPKAAVRVTKPIYGGLATSDLVALQSIQQGEVILEERAVMQWGKEIEAAEKNASDQEKVLFQRVAAIMKMASSMSSMSGLAELLLPSFQSYLTARSRRKELGDAADEIWKFPWEINHTSLSRDDLKIRVGFGVLAYKGLSKTIHEKHFSDHTQVARLFTISELGGIPTPFGRGLYKYSSIAKRIKRVKQPLVSVGCRPGKQKQKMTTLPSPNCDYTFTDDGTLVLTARRRISFGDCLSIPLDKIFEASTQSALEILRDRTKLAEAAIHQAKVSSAPQILKDYAKARHPKVSSRPLISPKANLNLRDRNVSSELWSEILNGSFENPFKRFTSLVDYTFDNNDCRQIIESTESITGSRVQSMPFHLGFDYNSRSVSPEVFTPVLQYLFKRSAQRLPKSCSVNGNTLQLVGTSESVSYFRLTPGEEILPFRMCPSTEEGTYGLPMMLSLSSCGKVIINNDSVALKSGRIILWSGDLTHSVPVCYSGDMVVMFTYLIYK